MQKPELKNMYFALRHGESMPNVRGVIVSNPWEGGRERHALTKNGENQVLSSVEAARKEGLLDGKTIIYSSPFSRCTRTAEIAKHVLGVESEIMFDDRLRERWFGDWEGTSNVNYQKVWDRDISDANHKDAHVESTTELAGRVASLIHDLENMYSHNNILLVSHGDVLQILQAFFEDQLSSTHRNLQPLKVAEVRRVH
jgi:probable phosphoglycerate mutase